jgi:hypothetical protein
MTNTDRNAICALVAAIIMTLWAFILIDRSNQPSYPILVPNISASTTGVGLSPARNGLSFIEGGAEIVRVDSSGRYFCFPLVRPIRDARMKTIYQRMCHG